jgi:hypothetical protein
MAWGVGQIAGISGTTGLSPRLPVLGMSQSNSNPKNTKFLPW